MGPTQPLFNGHRGYFLGTKRSGREADHSPPSNAEVESEWRYTVPLWRGQNFVYRPRSDRGTVSALAWEDKQTHDERYSGYPVTAEYTGHSLTHSLTPWSRVLLEKLTGFQLVKKFPALYGTRRFITAFTSARHMSLSMSSSIQSVPTHHTS